MNALLADLLYRLRALVRRQSVEDELDEELRFHLEREVEKHLSAGLSWDEAWRRARHALGGLDQAKEKCRDVRGTRWIEELFRSLGHALRTLSRSPGFASVSVLTLAIGIGASTAVFSLVDGILLKPFGYPEPERLVVVSQSVNVDGQVFEGIPVSAAHFREWKNRAGSLEGIALMRSSVRYITGTDGDPHRVFQVTVTPGFFEMLGVRPTLGRTFLESEAEEGHDRVLILSNGFWREYFQSDPDVVSSHRSGPKRRRFPVGRPPW